MRMKTAPLFLTVLFALFLQPRHSNAVCDYFTELEQNPILRKNFLAHFNYEKSLPVMAYGDLKRKSEKLLKPYEVSGVTLLLDRHTVECLGCHNEMMSPGFDRSGQKILEHNFHSAVGKHALGLDYYEKSRVSPQLYLQPDPNRNNFVFVGGKLGCLSCHNPFSTLPQHLNASIKDEALCNQCHRR